MPPSRHISKLRCTIHKQGDIIQVTTLKIYLICLTFLSFYLELFIESKSEKYLKISIVVECMNV